MAAARTSGWPGTRAGGLALMTGVILLLITSLLHPGGALIDPVDQTDSPAQSLSWPTMPALRTC